MRNRWLSYGLAILLWLACAYEIVLIALRSVWGGLEETPVFGRLLTKSEESVAAILIVAVVGWLLLEILLHARRVQREHTAVRQFIGVLQNDLGDVSLSPRTRAGQRLQFMRTHAQRPAESVQEAVAASAALDASVIENTYSLTKTYVWILPVLGFIGTAWGMAHAISGFSQALGETQDPKILADRLGQLVIPGLSNAFAVTMLALGAAVVTHFCVTTVQSWDQEALDELDQASVALLARSPRGDGGGVSSEVLSVLKAIQWQLRELSEQLDLTKAAGELVAAGEVLGNAAAEMEVAAGDLKSSVRMPYHITITREERG